MQNSRHKYEIWHYKEQSLSSKCCDTLSFPTVKSAKNYLFMRDYIQDGHIWFAPNYIQFAQIKKVY